MQKKKLKDKGEEANHISGSETRGSSRRKASRQLYKDNGSVRAFLAGSPFLQTSGKFSK